MGLGTGKEKDLHIIISSLAQSNSMPLTMKNYDLEVYLTTVKIAKTNALNVIIQGCFSKAVAMYTV